MLPERLKAENYDGPDEDFSDPNEKLYRRVKPTFWPREWPPTSSDILRHLISLPHCCVARARFCDSPRDAIIEWPEYGVVAWEVGEIPHHIADQDNRTFLTIVHSPNADGRNFYPHSEIQFRPTATAAIPSQPSPKTFRLFVRHELAKRISTELEPAE